MLRMPLVTVTDWPVGSSKERIPISSLIDETIYIIYYIYSVNLLQKKVLVERKEVLFIELA